MTESCCAAPAAPSVLETYRPLVVALGLSLGGGVLGAFSGRGDLMNWTMGLFLIMLAALQLADLRSFATLFRQYDPLARRLPGYGVAYPFIEALLGGLYLAGLWPLAANIVMLLIMGTGAAGVIGVLRRKEKLSCACAGAGYALPVGRVTLTEDGIMAAMAALNLLRLAGHSF